MLIGKERQRLRHADGVGQLDGAARGEPGADHVLGQLVGEIGGRSINLGRILAAEAAAAMRCHAVIGIDDDHAAGQPGVAVWPADLERAGGVDVPHVLVAQPALG